MYPTILPLWSSATYDNDGQVIAWYMSNQRQLLSPSLEVSRRCKTSRVLTVLHGVVFGQVLEVAGLHSCNVVYLNAYLWAVVNWEKVLFIPSLVAHSSWSFEYESFGRTRLNNQATGRGYGLNFKHQVLLTKVFLASRYEYISNIARNITGPKKFLRQ